MSKKKSDEFEDDDLPADEIEEDEAEALPEAEIEPDIEEVVVEDVEVEVEVEAEADEDEDEEDEDEEDELDMDLVRPVASAVARPPLRGQPPKSPLAREEPPPPFDPGERVILVQNTRPRTGTPIGPYPVGSTGKVETVLSQTAIVRFDMRPEVKEVVAFTCLKSAEKNPKPRPDLEQKN